MYWVPQGALKLNQIYANSFKIYFGFLYHEKSTGRSTRALKTDLWCPGLRSGSMWSCVRQHHYHHDHSKRSCQIQIKAWGCQCRGNVVRIGSGSRAPCGAPLYFGDVWMSLSYPRKLKFLGLTQFSSKPSTPWRQGDDVIKKFTIEKFDRTAGFGIPVVP